MSIKEIIFKFICVFIIVAFFTKIIFKFDSIVFPLGISIGSILVDLTLNFARKKRR